MSLRLKCHKKNKKEIKYDTEVMSCNITWVWSQDQQSCEAIVESAANAQQKYYHILQIDWESDQKEEIVKEKNHRPKMVSLVLMPIITNLDLIPNLTAVPTFPRNVIIINQFRMSLVRINDVCTLVLPIPQRKKRGNYIENYYIPSKLKRSPGPK